MLGPDCGGNFHYTKDGSKSCIDCNLPHRGIEGSKLIAQHWKQVKERASLEEDSGAADSDERFGEAGNKRD